MDIARRKQQLRDLLKSRRGRNALTFIAFLVVSAVLWIVQSLNDEAQRDIRLSVEIVNVPDSVTRITPLPESINVSVRSRGTTLLRFLFNKQPVMNIDYRTYINGNRIRLSDMMLKTYFRNMIGGGCQIQSVNPDSLMIYFTNRPGRKVAVKVDANVEPGPQFAIIGKVRSLTDSVRLYSIGELPGTVQSVTTAPIVLNNVSSSQTLRVALLTQPGSRAVPDSVEVHVEVEPLISKARKVEISSVNVPEGERMILAPGNAEVYYMVPMSIYKSANSDPRFVIVADYNNINPYTEKVPISLKSAPKDFIDVFLSVDSVKYLIEK